MVIDIHSKSNIYTHTYYLICVFETKIHVVQAGLELAEQLKMTLILLPLPSSTSYWHGPLCPAFVAILK